MQYTINIDENNPIVIELERLQFEVDARKEVLSFLISTNANTTDAFRIYEQEYIELYTTYQKIKAKFEKEIVMPYCREKNIEVFSWNLDFSTHSLIITK